jgi:phytoene dehydrogenase-like protein
VDGDDAPERLEAHAPVPALARQHWDAVIVGGGHNGLAAAAYLARLGHRVLVFERRARLGGACTLERPFADERWIVSPCAYVVGLLHPRIVSELDLHRRGYRVHLVDPHLWCPFEDGSSVTLWDDTARSRASVAELSPRDVDGYAAYAALFARIRHLLREGRRDTWVGDAPDRAELDELLSGDPEARDVVFDASIAQVVERYVADDRLRTALHGQGIIGTYAGPRDPGTASIHVLHTAGRLEGRGGAWGYVQGGMGRVALALADAAREAGVTLVTGVAVAAIVPGEGVRLPGGELVRARAVVSNADPKRTVALCEHGVPEELRRRVGAWRSDSPVLKVNCALRRLPRFTASAGDVPWHRAMVTISTGIDDTQKAYVASRAGVPSPAWCELYFPTAYDRSIAPDGCHQMSVFAQYVPYALEQGTWDGRREEIGDLAIAAIARFAPDVADTIVHRQVLGPPDVEERVGLSGGHIFQGECLPDQMWAARFAPRTSIQGVYLCGASTHPGGSVMAVNGRNAAMAVHHDLATGAEGIR